MLKTSLAFAFSILCIAYLPAASGQHCPPIVESYLQSVTVKHTEGGIALNIDYRKTGGQRKESYQAYILAYSHPDSEKISEMTPQAAIETKMASVVHTQLAKRQDNGCYSIQFSMETRDLVATMLQDSRIDRQRIDDYGGWKSFRDRIRFAVFIPFLEDEEFSVIEGLPANKHECNYLDEAALIFETLPQTISIHFGIVQAIRIPENEFYLQINGTRPSAKKKEKVN